MARLLLAASCAVVIATSGCSRLQSSSMQCGIAPMRLMMSNVTEPNAPAIVMIELRGDGQLFMPALHEQSIGRLGKDGCLVMKDLVTLELTPSGKLWTGFEVMKLDGNRLRSGDIVWTLQDDGVLTDSRDQKDGEKHPATRFDGYRPEARCAAMVMFAVILSMAPSMAAAEDAIPWLPPPSDSLCAARSHEQPAAR